MFHRVCCKTKQFYLLTAVLAVAASAPAQEGSDDARSPAWVKDLAAKARASVVVIEHDGRDGSQQGLGTGFAIDKRLVATNLHVIGEARPIRVQTADGKS